MSSKNDKIRICFYYEYKSIVGGLTSLLITLIKELRRQDVEVILFNYADGLVVQELKLHGIELDVVDIENINWSKLDDLIRDTDVLVITSFLEAFRRFLKVNPRILYYNINEDLPDVSKYKFGINPKPLARKLLSDLITSKALLLMNDIGIKGTAERLGFKIVSPKYLPIPVEVPNENNYLQQNTVASENLRMTYIGRSVDWKMYPLKKILDDLIEQKTFQGKPIVFTIVVDSKEDLAKYIDIGSYHNSCIKDIIILENIRPSKISAFLLENSDINFGMGTAALDSGKLGIPTIVVDSSRKPMPENYRYLWLHHSELFYVGENVEKDYEPLPLSISMSELLHQHTNSEPILRLHSNKTYAYVKDTHSVKSVASQLYQYACQTSFRLKMAKPYVLFYSFGHSIIKSIWLTIQPGRKTSSSIESTSHN